MLYFLQRRNFPINQPPKPENKLTNRKKRLIPGETVLAENRKREIEPDSAEQEFHHNQQELKIGSAFEYKWGGLEIVFGGVCEEEIGIAGLAESGLVEK